MKTPRVAQMYVKEQYWKDVEILRTEKGLPAWAFDFVSVHGPNQFDKKYALCSPMCLVDPATGKRPDFEDIKYDRKTDAIKAARKIARKTASSQKLHVVVCPNSPGGVHGG